MLKYVLAYGATAIAFCALDFAWLTMSYVQFIGVTTPTALRIHATKGNVRRLFTFVGMVCRLERK